MNIVDLFAGAGGMSEGFSQAGFNIIAANEILVDASQTYIENHKNTLMLTGDIQKISVNDFLTKCNISKSDIDIVIGGPPCQGFSMANRQKLINDPRNKLYKYFVNFVAETKPMIFVMENVKGIKSKVDVIINDFKNINYSVKYKIINAKDFGVPQNRERIFFIGTNIRDTEEKNIEIINKIFAEIDKHKCLEPINLCDALWGLRKLKPLPKKNMTNFESNEFGKIEDIILRESLPPKYVLDINGGKIPTKVFNHKTRYNNERDKEIFQRLPQGGNSNHPLIAEIMPYQNRTHIFKDKYYKLKSNTVSKTITAHMKFDCNMYIHPFESRGLTPREAARIQSFPDTYKFEGAFTRWYLQIGNAVPPLLAKCVGLSIKKIIDEVKKSNEF